MLVTFISQCSKKAKKTTRKVLDSFALRIGDNTWQTPITLEGLKAVHGNLVKTATKNTAVSCHRHAGSNSTELLWVVGSRSAFREDGCVPVHYRQDTSILGKDLENKWSFLPALKAVVACAALFHDFGKANDFFQEKLRSNKILADPVRHEWLSCIFLTRFLNFESQSSLEASLATLSDMEKIILDPEEIETLKSKESLGELGYTLVWLILSHHRLPCPTNPSQENKELVSNECYLSSSNKLKEEGKEPLNCWPKFLQEELWLGWNFPNTQCTKDENEQSRTFSKGLPVKDFRWQSSAKRWIRKLYSERKMIDSILENPSCSRLFLSLARLCLILGDHNYSSQPPQSNVRATEDALYANAQGGELKQTLTEHLLGVCEQSVQNVHLLPSLATDLDVVPDKDCRALRKPAKDVRYKWQDKAIHHLVQKKVRPQGQDRQGWFVVNMASTGCGKTIANAKIMRALSNDGQSLRFVLALGLRTLTLQTGDAYRKDIGLSDNQVAVCIGSQVIQELHEQKDNIHKDKGEENNVIGSESFEELWDGDINFITSQPIPDQLSTLMEGHHKKKNRQLLAAPVVSCTIDHMMPATEAQRGGRFILPTLRLLSSDLVIDEVDDFTGDDLIAIGRLVHLAGMLGRKVMLSSATIPPDLAEGYFRLYQAGWIQYATLFDEPDKNVHCFWVDEYRSQMEQPEVCEDILNTNSFQELHEQFVRKRVASLGKEASKRRAFIQKIPIVDKDSILQSFGSAIQEACLSLHQAHGNVCCEKTVSFGVVRVANIDPCVSVAQYLLEAEWPDGIAVKVLPYHSQQLLYLRHVQEKRLDKVLCRKMSVDNKGLAEALRGTEELDFIENAQEKSVLFILVATPVEEVGRDHDFDWAVIEPSSYRSIIQLAGRVLRHRFTRGLSHPNIAILEYNLKGYKELFKEKCSAPKGRRGRRNQNESKGDAVFNRPGFESSTHLLTTHRTPELLANIDYEDCIDARPRIERKKELKSKEFLIDLEHQVLYETLNSLDKRTADTPAGWIIGPWWLTAVPQSLTRFRSSEPQVKLAYKLEEIDEYFCEWNDGSWTGSMNSNYGICLKEDSGDKVWFERNFRGSLEALIDPGLAPEDYYEKLMHKSLRYGTITVRQSKLQNNSKKAYSDNFGLYSSFNKEI